MATRPATTVLKHFSDCLKACVRATDTIARLAGDEFVVLLPGLNTRADAETIARKIMREARIGFTVNGTTLNMATSIGIAYAREADVTPEALFASADNALYAAKNGDRDTFRLVECSLADAVRQPSRRRNDAGRGLSNVEASSQDSRDSR